MLHSFGDAIVSDEGIQNVGLYSALMARVTQVVDRTYASHAGDLDLSPRYDKLKSLNRL